MQTNFKSYVLRSIKNKKLNVFGLFVLISFLILVITKLSETYVETIPFSIEYKNLPENSIITLDSMPKINVTLSTHGFKLLSYYFYDKTYQIDFKSSSKLNNTTYLWLAEKGAYDLKKQLGQAVDIVSIKPDTIWFPYGTLSVKMVPVILKANINFVDGYDSLEGFELIPDSVKLIGSESEIAKIDYIETSAIVLNDIKEDLNTSVSLELANASERLKLSEETVKLNAKIEKFTEGTFEIPVTILNKPDNVELNYFPKLIKVSYYLSLKDYKLVKPHDFKIECDYNDIVNSKVSFFTPKLLVNSNTVKSAELKQNKVDYIIMK